MTDFIIQLIETVDRLWIVGIAYTLPTIIAAIRMPRSHLVRWMTSRKK